MDDSTVLASYRPPSKMVLDKEIDHVDAHCAAFIGLSPFAMLSTASADGWPEISPRGGGRGFVHVLDEHRLAMPDRTGNNRLDSLRKVAANPRVALQFFVPGFEETLKVYGTTTLVEPDALGTDLTEFGKPPRSVLVVQVTGAYFHCAKAVMRAGLWDAEAQVDRATFAPFGQVLRDHCALETPLPDDATIRADLALEL